MHNANAEQAAPILLDWQDALGLAAEYSAQLKAVLDVLQNAIADEDRAATQGAVSLAMYLNKTISNLFIVDSFGLTRPAPHP